MGGIFFLTEKKQWKRHTDLCSACPSQQKASQFSYVHYEMLFVPCAEHRMCPFCRDADRDPDLRVGASSNQAMFEPQFLWNLTALQEILRFGATTDGSKSVCTCN